jgi:branched-chain amino acid transport system substrate-binding protein
VAALLVAAACGDDSGGSSTTAAPGTTAAGTTAGGATTAGGSTATTAAGTSAAGTTAAPASSSGGPATGTPIKLGAVASFSGVDIFPESPNMAKAYFDRVNKNGGINGHPIEYSTEDDGDTPEQAAVAAKRLVEEKGVVALVGGGSIVDCTTNAKYYGEQGILSLAGVEACGPDASNVASLNTGPFLGILMTLTYMLQVQKLEKLCFSSLNIGLTPIFTEIFQPMWEQAMNTKLNLILSEPNEDLTAAVTKAKSDGCQGVLLGYTEPNYIAYAQIAESQGLTGGDIQYAMLTSGYSLNVLDKLGSAGEGWISNSEFAPYTDEADTSPDMADFKALAKEAGLDETSFAQGGYLSAWAMTEALKTIQGDYTKESVGAAIKALNLSTPMLGVPLTWVPYEGGKQLNNASKIVQIKDGKFVTISDWVFWPPA